LSTKLALKAETKEALVAKTGMIPLSSKAARAAAISARLVVGALVVWMMANLRAFLRQLGATPPAAK